MRHALTCWITSRWKRRRYHQPFWRDDKTAKMLGVAGKGCPRCGAGVVPVVVTGTLPPAGAGTPEATDD